MPHWMKNQQSFFNEFLYYNVIQEMNAELVRTGNPVIKTSQARYLRTKLDEQLASMNEKPLAESMPHPIMEAFSQLAKAENIKGADETLMKLSHNDTRTAIANRCMMVFKGFTGIRGKTDRNIPSVDPNGEWLPVSPYMPELANRDCVIQLGSNLGLIRADDIKDLVASNDPTTGVLSRGNLTKVLSANRQENQTYVDARMYRYAPNTDGSFSARNVAAVYNEHDASGVAALRPFMSDKEFSEITSMYDGKPWTSAAKNSAGQPLFMSDASITRARDVVAALRARGEHFEFKKDTQPGQVCIQFDNKMQMRVIDPYDESFACGRVYDEGYVVMLQTYDSSNRNAPWVTFAPRSTQESLDLLDVAMGRSVKRWDAKTDADKVGIPMVEDESRYSKKKVNAASHSQDNFRANIGEVNNRAVSVFFKKYSRTGVKIFKTPEDAENYLHEMVDSSRKRFYEDLDVESIIDLAHQREANSDEYGDAVPMYSSDPVVKAVQEKYWRALTTDDKTLYNPKYVTVDDDENEHVDVADREAAMYEGEIEDVIRKHAVDMSYAAVGEYLGPGEGPQFDPVLVSRYSDNGRSMFRNNDDILSALRRADFQPDDLTGNAFYNDVVRGRLVSFNPDTAKFLGDEAKKSPFMNAVYKAVGSSIRSQGCEIETVTVLREDGRPVQKYNLQIDDNGVIQYTAYQKTRREVESKTGSPDEVKVIGQIGQVFAPDEHGVVHTKTHLFVPGYEGTVTPNKPGENKPYEERIKLRGYEQVLTEAIREEIHETFLSQMRDGESPDNPDEKIKFAGNPTALNKAVQHLYDMRLPLDFYESHEKGGSREGISQELQQAIIDTCRGRIKLDNDLMEESGRQNLYRAVNRPGAVYDQFNDNKLDGISLTDGRNPAVLEAPGDGLFDPYFTGNGPAQGNIRYLAIGAEVGADGYVKPAKDRNARCPLVKYMQDKGRQPDFDAVDRMCMSGNGLLQGLRETEPVGMAQVTFGFQTFEDGIVISKEFAEANRVPSAHGEGMRPLKSGDKIECHGNKGVVSLIVDRNMDLDEAEKLGIRDAVEWYRANPGLDVVMSPYSAVSRFNAGMAREAMANNPETLVAPDGTVYPGALGHVRMTVLKQTVDTKSHSNTEDGQQRRSYGAQFTWALAANDCPKVLEDSFGDNFKAIADVREYLITCGMDMDETGRFLNEYHPQAGEKRNIFVMPELDYTGRDGQMSPRMTLNKSRMTDAFSRQISTRGGFLEMPFPLKYPNGTKFQEAEASSGDGKVYLMPVMSSYMRSGQEFQSGESVTHDWTNEYMRIFERSLAYRDAENRKNLAAKVEEARSKQSLGETLTQEMQDTLDTYGPWYDKTMQSFQKDQRYVSSKRSYAASCDAEMKAAVDAAQADYDKITREIKDKKFTTKYNVFRTGIMASKQKDSATAVWHPDPTCPLDAVRMGADMAETLKLAYRDKDGSTHMKPNAMALVHRDPVLRGSGVRYMRVELDPELVGISVHPAGIPGGMDGDFDGDSVGVHVPGSVEAKAEARDKLSVKANLLDKSSYDPKTGRYKLFIADGQDVAAGWAADAERRAKVLASTGKPAEGLSLKDRYTELEVRVNDFEKKFAEHEIDQRQVTAERARAVQDVQTYLSDCAKAGFGRHVLSYASPEAHIQSIERYVDDGAKGSLGKVKTYAKFAGIEYQTSSDGHLVPGTAVMHEKSLAARDDHIGILKAKNMQQQYTGTGGSFSIRAMRALTNVCPDEASRLNYLATQGVLQSKHDPHMSDKFEHILSGPARDLWRGYKLERVPGEHLKNQSFDLEIDRNGNRRMVTRENDTVAVSWKPVKDGKNYVRATPEEFKQQFMDIYGSGDGLGLKVNPLLVDKIAQACSEDVGGRRVMMSIEPEEDKGYGSFSACNKYAAPLQRLAYDGTFDTIQEIAACQKADPNYPGLFDVPAVDGIKRNYNRSMADATVMRHNLDIRDAMREAAAEGVAYEGEAFKPIIRPDVIVDGRQRNIRSVKVDTHLTADQRARQSDAQRRAREKAATVLIPDETTLRDIEYGPFDDGRDMSVVD